MSCEDIILSTVEFPKQMELTDIDGNRFIFPDDVWAWFGELGEGNGWFDALDKMRSRIPRYWYKFDEIGIYYRDSNTQHKQSCIRRNSLIFIFFREMIEKYGAEIWYNSLWTHMDHGTGEGLCPVDININPYIKKEPIAQTELDLKDNVFYRFVLK